VCPPFIGYAACNVRVYIRHHALCVQQTSLFDAAWPTSIGFAAETRRSSPAYTLHAVVWHTLSWVQWQDCITHLLLLSLPAGPKPASSCLLSVGGHHHAALRAAGPQGHSSWPNHEHHHCTTHTHSAPFDTLTG
jgi:hypothetical protein